MTVPRASYGNFRNQILSPQGLTTWTLRTHARLPRRKVKNYAYLSLCLSGPLTKLQTAPGLSHSPILIGYHYLI